MADQPPPLHEGIAPLGFLLGTWRGEGRGTYPTIEDFGYREEISFSQVGKPFLAYGQKTRHADTGLPLHAETGYWRLPGPETVELVLAHPTGILETLVGTLTVDGPDAAVIDLASHAVTLTPSAKEVTATHRRFTLEGDELRYEVAMAAVGEPLTHHLAATLIRVPAG